MKRFKAQPIYLLFILILSSFVISGCGGDGEVTGHWLPSNAPVVTAINPVDIATGVCVNKIVTATFNKAMNASTITAPGIFTVKQTVTGTNVPGIVTYDATTMTATFTRTVNYTAGINYTATIKGGVNGVKDSAGKALPTDKVWSFTVDASVCSNPPPGGAASCAGPGPVDLGSAATYAVLAGTAFTFADPQTITGDVGSPSITPAAFGASSTVIGTVRDAGTDPAPGAIQTAVTDLQTAFACATVTRPCDAGPAFNFAADTDFAALPQPLAAGHYCVTGAMSVGSNLTLTNPGVYIFESTGALDTAAGPIAVTLGGAANASNTVVYWVPGGITTIQANVAFLGSILSNNAAITLNANSTLLGGRALSGAAVNLLSTNEIAIP